MRLSATATYRPRGDLGRFVEAHVTPAVRASVEAAAKLITQSAKYYCPVDTGLLQSRITWSIDETGRTIVGTVYVDDVFYAVFVEYGTIHMSAQPFMRPAMDENREPIMRLFRSEIAVGLK